MPLIVRTRKIVKSKFLQILPNFPEYIDFVQFLILISSCNFMYSILLYLDFCVSHSLFSYCILCYRYPAYFYLIQFYLFLTYFIPFHLILFHLILYYLIFVTVFHSIFLNDNIYKCRNAEQLGQLSREFNFP